MRKLFLLILSVAFPLTLAAAEAIPPAAANPANPIVSLSTDRGKIEIELFATQSPQTVANFLRYVRSGFYDGVVFDRVVPDFVIEAGGRAADGSVRASYPAIGSEAANGLKNLAGTVGLARESDLGSGANYFYVNLKDNPHLDHTGEDPEHYGYTVFGKVISGMDVAAGIATPPASAAPIPQTTIQQARIERDVDPPTVIAAKEKTYEDLSEFYSIDKLYRSMTGPQSTRQVSIEPGPPELLWIVGYSADVVGDAGDPTGLDQFMCHSNLDLDPGEHLSRLQISHDVNPRLFTLSQGQMDIHFPAGFGVPILSDEKLSLTTQVLNLNYADCGLNVRHRTRIRYVRDRDLPFSMTPLFEDAVYGLKVLSGADGRYGIDPASHEGHDMASCLPGQNAASYEYHDAYNRTFTGHWVVPPGREVNRTPVDAMLRLSQDTTIHYIAVHLHPFAESLELYDKTDGKSVWKSSAKNPEGRIGLDRVDTFGSEKGIPIYHDHHYELISTYNNTSKENQDSMAVMFLYLKDPVFQKPKLPPATVASR
jgi:cyclophilin family peptidyl-prolyl cis-trans isomerase